MARLDTEIAHRRAAQCACLLVMVAFVVLTLTSLGSAAPSPDSADLTITKADSPDPVRVGGSLTYAIQVNNRGPATATGVVVNDELPRDVDFVSATATTGQCSQKKRKVSCALGSVGAGVNYGPPPNVTITVIPREPGTITNTASVEGAQQDPAKKNNKATAATRVLGAATCRGATATIAGTPGDDTLLGTGGPDVIVALAGNDRIESMAGRDLICAGSGNDYIGAGSAADRVLAGAGTDRALGRGGTDVLRGGANNDILKGGRGADHLRGGRGFDVCRGGAGADSIRGCER
jgi:uncharacterized repeat protein (TIGR01451 family)